MSTLLADDTHARSDLRPRGSTFAGLVGVELRRLWWRRLAKVAVIGVVLFVGVATFSAYQETRPEAIAQRIDEYNRVVAEMKAQRDAMPEEERQAQLASCQRQEAEVRSTDPTADLRCEEMNEPPPLEAFGLVNTARSEMTRGIALGGVYLFGFLAFLLGASFIAAEFGSGSMGTWLTFQPGRLRVGTAKLVAATGGGLAIGALGVGLAALGAFLVTTVNRPDSPLGLPEAPAVAGDSLAQTLLRVTAAVALGGLGGAVIALIVRATAGVIGIVVGYSVVAEGFLANELGGGRLQPWLVRLNLESFLDKGARYFVTVCGDSDCTSKQLTNSYTHGWVYLLVLAVVGVTAALAVFRRRDVS